MITQVITESREEKLQPRIEIVAPETASLNKERVVLKRYYLPSGANLEVKNGQKVHAGDVLAKIPREVGQN